VQQSKTRTRWAKRNSGLTAFLIAGGVLLAAGQNQQNGQQSSNSQPPGQPSPDRAWTASGPVAFTPNQADRQNFDAANLERRKQLADDSAKLVKLATDLKTEVDKTTKDTLSLSVIRKADEIEKLAHSVKEKMRLTAGAN
jgi:hypothetical protein